MNKESDEHNNLKIVGRLLLKNMGFRADEIHEEQPFSFNGSRYIVDLIGSSELAYKKHMESPDLQKVSSVVVIECGSTKPEKLIDLRASGALVLHLPYKDFSGKLILSDETNQEIKDIAKSLKDQHDSYIERIGEIYFKLNEVEAKILRINHDTNEIEKKQKEIFDSAISKLQDRYATLNDGVSSIFEFKQAIYKFLNSPKTNF